eukprot:7167484-Lingulodinium_polyedra.AAC.1
MLRAVRAQRPLWPSRQGAQVLRGAVRTLGARAQYATCALYQSARACAPANSLARHWAEQLTASRA